MICRIIIFLLLVVLIQSQEISISDSVNIKEIVQQQIAEAKKREARVNKAVQVTFSPVKKYDKPIINLDVTDYSMINKVLVLGIFSTLVLSVVAYRRKKLIKKNNLKEFKTNIQLMRQERFIKPIDPKLKKIRTGLCLNSKYLNNDEHAVTSAAKRYKIAKTELLLAAKFNNHSVKAL